MKEPIMGINCKCATCNCMRFKKIDIPELIERLRGIREARHYVYENCADIKLRAGQLMPHDADKRSPGDHSVEYPQDILDSNDELFEALKNAPFHDEIDYFIELLSKRI